MRVKAFKVEEYNLSDRYFQLLFYQLSHGEMIIRSHKNDNNTIDIYFGDVKYIEIPRALNGIIFIRPNEEDIRYLESKDIKEFTEDEVVVIMSNKKKYYVVASEISIIESDLLYMELPIHCFLHNIK